MRLTRRSGVAAFALLLTLPAAAAMAQEKPGPTVTAKAEPPQTAAAAEAVIVEKRLLPRPFAVIAGSWSGGGTISATGGQEKLRCQAKHTVSNDSQNLALNFRCASDSFKFEVTSKVAESQGTFSGSWVETSTGVTGSISGRVAGNQIAGVAQGAGYTADIAVTTTGNRQSVTITPHAALITGVQITLSRR